MLLKRKDIISSIYLLSIVLLTMLNVKTNLAVIGVYLIFNILLITEVESLISVCVVVSTIAYYFVGADEGIYSIYTLLILVIIIKKLLDRKFVIPPETGKSLLYGFALIVIAIISYNQSKYEYFNGLVELIYIIIVSALIACFCYIDYKKLIHCLVMHACILILLYAIFLPFQYSYLEGRYSISENVNFNTFGMSCAQLATIILLDILLCEKRRMLKKAKILVFIVALVLLYLSGSRTSLFAVVAAIAIILTIIANRKEVLSRTARRSIIVGLVIMVAGIGVANFLGLDLSNYDYIVLLRGGGTNRFTIYQFIIPYIIAGGYYKFGYGPGHECSRIIVSQLVGRNYAHTHNLYIEAFGELGIGGLLLTGFIIFRAIKLALKTSHNSVERYIPFGMLICLLINGLGESYFCDIIFWLLLALCTNTNGVIEQRNEESI